nr:MAG TPA: hypothetical protein [Caudoviricetes sp.]
MYTGSFAASLKGIACTRGFVILLACVSTSIFLLSPAKVFLLFRLRRTLYVAFPVGWECQLVSPTAGKQRFDSVTQHNDSSRIAWKNSPYDNLPRYSRLSMK